MKSALLIGSALLVSALPSAASAEPVLLISIDGLQPADLLKSEERGIQVPNLKRFITNGTYAERVKGVLPTVTYPSHATLLTGVGPAKHGIVGNNSFDPMQINQNGWYWYATDLKVPTLWDAAAKAGLSSANVHWPISVQAKNVTWNIPQIWRTGHKDDAKLLKALATPDLIESLETDLGSYAPGIDESIEADETRGRFASALISREKPYFTTVYLTALDHEQHEKGPDTAAAYNVLARIDKVVGQIVAAQMASHPDSVIAVVSDHGFSKVDTEINLYRAFIDAGLIVLDSNGKINSWEASPWNSGGSSAIVLARPADAALKTRVAHLLAGLQKDPKNCITEIAERPEIARLGGNPEASFYISFSPNAYAGGFKGPSAPLVSRSTSKGMHGYFPHSPLMLSSFMMMGKDIANGRNLGEIDMRAIAPTLAKAMGITLPDAEMVAVR
ncbi:alkaline phosphatase family protein [Sphingorhabdus wooponensis]|uniref:Alkaline phosphatase family protein n=1 Tax=Sphingorhabdus wooponensis TaxID=940136 RepID=A0A3R8RCY7_9SPHN|nr:ectonucleotide pyrophosphatase/phosphodiesterase [Sphingorhabdus wooponensis]RRQ52127.1 alkaline phosphatase family protein [Sphingorhabdus wooponensis]